MSSVSPSMPFIPTVPHESTLAQIDAAVQAAVSANDQWAASSAAARSRLLRELASALEANSERLIALANEETFLGTGRLTGELARTAFQLRAFADAIDAGEAFTVIDDAAVPGAPPAGHPRLLRVNVPLGPVAMFSASNFPFAFSVLGGDTAAALAAGCPVIVKAHPAHPKLSEAVFALATETAQRADVPAGVLGMVSGAARDVGVALVRHPDIAAVAFTGSYHGGMALQKEINARPKPIPFYGELGSINPIIALPPAVESQCADLAQALAASIAQGCGQFCTSPGVLITYDSQASDHFIEQLACAMDAQNTHAMLSPAIRQSFNEGVARLGRHPAAKRVTANEQHAHSHPVPNLVTLDTAAFVSDAALREEIFGPSCIVVRVKSITEMEQVLSAIGGSLTVTVWGADHDDAQTRQVVRSAIRIAGRVLFSGVPTGVAVTRAQHHGGPFPASTQPQTTSVGLMAMHRFLRPVALQEPPSWLVQRSGVPL